MTEAEAAQAGRVDERLELLVVTVGGHRCALELGRVLQVVDYPRVTHVPGTPAAVDGVASVGGEVAAVLDARTLFGLSGSDDPSFALLDRRADAQAVGVVACHVDTVEQHPVAAFTPPAEFDDGGDWPFPVDARWVRAVLTVDADEPIPVLDVDALVAAVAGEQRDDNENESE